jgi:hypothetical protein
VRKGLNALGAGEGGASDEKPKRRHLNLEEKRALRTADVAYFVKAYSRKAQKRREPNDRHYSRELEQKLKQLMPEELDRLLRDDED